MNKRIIVICAFLVAFATGCTDKKTSSDVSLKLDPQKVEWFKDAKFGMFIHWGLYSILEGSYNGHTMPDKSFPQGNSWYAEWIKPRLEVPDDYYNGLVNEFNPVNYDPESWVREAFNAGMKYLVITAKHHDGFALWDSKVSDFDIAATPYKKDLLGPLVAACKKYGLKYGFYYSHWQDWEDPDGAMPFWYPWRPDEDFEKYWQRKSLPQVKELIEKYDPDLLWFDTWGWDNHITPERRDELIRLVRTYSDKCLINGRICFSNPGENIDFLEMHDNSYPKEMLDKPWQTPATMQNSWAYHSKDYNWKPATRMLRYLVSNTSMGGNYLLNVGPKADGTLPVPAVRRLREMGAWLGANGEAIYGTKPSSLKVDDGEVYLTEKTDGDEKYLYILITEPKSSVSIPSVLTKGCCALETGQVLDIASEGGCTEIRIPESLFKDSSIVVLKAEL
ncbi:MAG: alpha-L-fucosidase [Bacteroidales bacterium]|nr:alpha-L-fucosidase [Bacteroidales bacterium]